MQRRMHRAAARFWRAARSIHASALLSLWLGLIGSAAQAEQSPLELETRIPLGIVKGRIDHLAVDLLRQHLFVAELENNSLAIVDSNNGGLRQRITGLKQPQVVGYVPTVDTLFVANGGDGSLRLFRGGDFAATANMLLGKDADNVRFDADAKSVYVGYGAGALAVIDPSSHAKIKDIALPAHPESFQISEDGHSKRQRVHVTCGEGAIDVFDAGNNYAPAVWFYRPSPLRT